MALRQQSGGAALGVPGLGCPVCAAVVCSARFAGSMPKPTMLPSKRLLSSPLHRTSCRAGRRRAPSPARCCSGPRHPHAPSCGGTRDTWSSSVGWRLGRLRRSDRPAMATRLLRGLLRVHLRCVRCVMGQILLLLPALLRIVERSLEVNLHVAARCTSLYYWPSAVRRTAEPRSMPYPCPYRHAG